MKLFLSDFYFNNITDIKADMLKNLKIDTLFLDIDNTIKPYGAKSLNKSVLSWILYLKENNIKIILCSNNFDKNVRPFAEKYKLSFVSMCLKPSPFGYIRALIKSGSKRKNILVCGDQIFTDIFGANLMNLKSALIEPIDVSLESKTVAFRRWLFKSKKQKILKKCLKE